jgi:hypothetical protein
MAKHQRKLKPSIFATFSIEAMRLLLPDVSGKFFVIWLLAFGVFAGRGPEFSPVICSAHR